MTDAEQAAIPWDDLHDAAEWQAAWQRLIQAVKPHNLTARKRWAAISRRKGYGSMPAKLEPPAVPQQQELFKG